MIMNLTGGARRRAAMGLRALAAGVALSLGASAAGSQEAAPLDLRNAVLRVLAHDPALRAAREGVAVASAEGVQARSRLWPNAGLSASHGKSRDKDLGLEVDRTRRQSDAYLRWNVFNGLSDRNNIAASERELTAAEEELQRAHADACERAAEAFVDVLRLQDIAQRAARRREEVDGLVGKVGAQVKQGKASEADGQHAVASLIDATVTQENAVADLEAARARLRTLLGEAPFGALVETMPPTFAQDLPALPDLWDRARTGNAQWRAAIARAEAARERIGIIAPEYLPKVDLEVRKNLTNHVSPASSSSETQRGWTIGLSYDIPLGGEAGGRRDEARHRAAAAEAEAQRVADSVRIDLTASQQRLLQSGAAVPQLDEQIRNLEGVVRAHELQWDSGRRSLMQLIDVRDSRYAAEQRAADNRYRWLTSRLRLLVLTGMLPETLGIDPAR